jgi:hypothetical protein
MESFNMTLSLSKDFPYDAIHHDFAKLNASLVAISLIYVIERMLVIVWVARGFEELDSLVIVFSCS